MILSKVTDLIGNTPILGIPIPSKKTRLLLKIEKNNPGGSIKDRMARNMIVAAMRSGRLQPGGVVVESSSGNTGIGLAIAAIEFGLRFIAVVDHHAAPDKIAVMRALGAEIRYVEGDYREDEVAVVERQRLAAEVASKIPGAVFMNQSDNVANAGGYFDFVREVIDQVQGPVDAYVGCVGTGGSMTGIARGLKLHNPRTRTIAVEPAGSIIFGQPGRPYYQSGTGTPKGDTVGLVLDYSCIDLGVQVTDQGVQLGELRVLQLQSLTPFLVCLAQTLALDAIKFFQSLRKGFLQNGNGEEGARDLDQRQPIIVHAGSTHAAPP